MNTKKKSDKSTVNKVIADNRRARREYSIDETFEAGLVLTGTEVKALREGQATIKEAYASPENDGIWLINANIPEYSAGNRQNHEPKRPRKLLLSKRQIAKLAQAVERKGYTIAPLKLYFNEKGKAKLEIGLAIGRKAHDKRNVEKERDWSRQKQRLLRDRG
ncbi:MAG: SsrA-binding protein SmpB [Pseudomonadota bacterium]